MPYSQTGIRRLVLASGSPRRRQLLPLLGLPFVIKTVGVDERALDGEAPTELVLRIGRAKAVAISEARPDELVVAADTVVVLNGEVLGKPTGPDDAVRMLRLLRGRSHIVYTGVCVWHAGRRRMASELAESLVWMREYTDAEIAKYVESGDPLDKAGAYAIQHAGFCPAACVEGCYLTVVGLPLCHLQRALSRFGLVVPSSVPAACQALNQRTCTAFRDNLTDV
jgi:septum formation protein